MRKLLILLAVFSLILPSLVSAKLYKCKNEQGEVVYTDKACQGGTGEELKLAPFSTYKPNIKSIPFSTNTEKKASTAVYTLFKIIKPKDDKLLSSVTGRVNVAFRLEGPLQSLKGHKFAIALDGKKLKTRGVTNQIRLDSVNPGTHTLQVFVMDAEDKVIKSSGVVTFHMKHKGRLNSPTPGQIQPPTDENGNQVAPELINGVPGSVNNIPGGAGTIPGGLPNIPGGRR